MSIAKKKILVTGATGFIGGRLVEVLIQQHACRVRALVHSLSHAARIARFPVEMTSGDVADKAVVAQAAMGCDVIIHAATGTSGDAAERRRATVDGTEAVLKAGFAARVQRVVHLSTISVYGMTPDGDLNEEKPRGRLPDEYSRNKADAEKLALDYHRGKGLPVAVVQPTVVYGPFAGSWTVTPLQALRTEQVVLPNGGSGLCNAVYVDDVVDAIIRAACVPEAVGECFLVSAAEPVTWKEFYGAYEDMLGFQSTVSVTETEFLREVRPRPWRDFTRDAVALILHPKVQRRIERNLLLRIPSRVVRALIPTKLRERLTAVTDRPKQINGETQVKPRKLPDKERFGWLAAKTRVRIDKARAVLAFQPKFDLRAGMLRTRLWAKWAGLVD